MHLSFIDVPLAFSFSVSLSICLFVSLSPKASAFCLRRAGTTLQPFGPQRQPGRPVWRPMPRFLDAGSLHKTRSDCPAALAKNWGGWAGQWLHRCIDGVFG